MGLRRASALVVVTVLGAYAPAQAQQGSASQSLGAPQSIAPATTGMRPASKKPQARPADDAKAPAISTLGAGFELDQLPHASKNVRSRPRDVPRLSTVGDLGRVPLDTGSFGFSSSTKMNPTAFPDGSPLVGITGGAVKHQGRSFFGLSLSVPTEDAPPVFLREAR